MSVSGKILYSPGLLGFFFSVWMLVCFGFFFLEVLLGGVTCLAEHKLI